MATLTADRHLVQTSLLDPHEEEHAPQPPQPRIVSPSRPTLDDLVAGTWDSVMRTHTAACLICGDDLTPRWSSGPHPVAAKCGTCGSELS
jgi:hypothetical protein